MGRAVELFGGLVGAGAFGFGFYCAFAAWLPTTPRHVRPALIAIGLGAGFTGGLLLGLAMRVALS